MAKFDKIGLATVLAVAAAATASCDDEKDHGWDAASKPTRVCVDQQGKRVAENECAAPRTGGGISPFLWYYLAMNAQRNFLPGYGGVVGGGSFRPAPGAAYGFAPPGGIARGGFGGTARSFGGLGGEGFGE